VTSGADRGTALPREIRAPLAISGLLGAIVAVTLAILFAGQDTGSRLDAWLTAALELPPGRAPTLYPLSLIVQGLADPIPAAVLMLLLAATCWRLGRRRLALLAVAGPAAADTVVMVMKPLVGRTIHGGSLSYPSTHAAQITAYVLVIALLVLSQLSLSTGAATAVVLGAAAAGALVMGWAQVAGSVHYATDTLGGFCVAVAVVPLVGWGIDLAADRIAVGRQAQPAS